MTLNSANVIQSSHRVFSPEFKHLQRTPHLQSSPPLIPTTETYYLTNNLINNPSLNHSSEKTFVLNDSMDSGNF